MTGAPGTTPGPWEPEDTNSARLSMVVVSTVPKANGSTVIIGQCAGPERNANAHQIAAAPELYDALEMFRGFGCPVCSGDCGSANPPVTTCPMQQASRALAKARGES